MSKANSPYRGLPGKAFWKSAVAERHYFEMEELSRPIRISLKDRIATAGSCFAQHIGRHLQRSGATYLDMEPRPAFVPPGQGRRFGFDTYSCRYGNVYTARQLRQLAEEALAGRVPQEYIWRGGDRFYDALRPSVDPIGQATPVAVSRLRRRHLKAVAEMLRTLDVFVFTMGLTEAWVSKLDGTVYPTAAGTIAGEHDPSKYEFSNFRYPEVHEDMMAFIRLLRGVNPEARVLLTVSPVPLAATASDDHVLVATTRSKAVLRAVAADLAEDVPGVFYFPSFEIISSHPGRGMFFEPDLRNVNESGVSLVMRHFFGALRDGTPDAAGGDASEGTSGTGRKAVADVAAAKGVAAVADVAAATDVAAGAEASSGADEEGVVCDEALLDGFAVR